MGRLGASVHGVSPCPQGLVLLFAAVVLGCFLFLRWPPELLPRGALVLFGLCRAEWRFWVYRILWAVCCGGFWARLLVSGAFVRLFAWGLLEGLDGLSVFVVFSPLHVAMVIVGMSVFAIWVLWGRFLGFSVFVVGVCVLVWRRSSGFRESLISIELRGFCCHFLGVYWRCAVSVCRPSGTFSRWVCGSCGFGVALSASACRGIWVS
ncbi:hypothetical protein SAMN04515648_4503 [Phyllobacterium sp. CL33Tsu]|nr:hypothetical protein SAMN04515648_4503 [Phyllobacterium sp. CL33Tsu]